MPDEKTEAFLQSVCGQVRCRPMHAEIREELLSHIGELHEQVAAQGCTGAQAEEAAIAQMGSPEEIGASFNRIHRPRTEWSVLIITVLLVATGIVMDVLYQRGHFSASQEQALFSHYVTVMAGALVLAFFYFFDLKKLQRAVFPIYLVSMAGFAGLVSYNFVRVSDRQISGFEVSPLLLLVPVVVWSFAGSLARFGGDTKGILTLSLVSLAPVGGLFLLDWGWCTALGVTFLILLLHTVRRQYRGRFKKTLRLIYAALLALLGGGDIGVYILTTIQNRDYYSQVSTSIWSQYSLVGSGKLVQMGDLPNSAPTVDALFQYFGILPTLAVFFVMGVLAVRLIRAARRIGDPCYRLVALAASIVLILGAAQQLPFVGGLGRGARWGLCTLPFLEFNSSALLMDMVFAGMMLGCFRRKDITPRLGMAPPAEAKSSGDGIQIL